MTIDLTDNEKRLILFLLNQVTIKPIDKDAIVVSTTAQGLLEKLTTENLNGNKIEEEKAELQPA